MKPLLALALCALPLATPVLADDRGYLTALLEDNLSDAGRKVTITGFQGALSSQATIDELTIADDRGTWLTLRRVVLDWNRAALLAGRVSVNTLSASEIILDRLPETGSDDSLPTPEARGFALPELPVSVQVGQLAAEKITLGETVLGQPVQARLQASADLSGGEGHTDLTLERTDTGPRGKFVLKAGFANETGVLTLDLTATEGAEGIATTLMGLPGAPAVDLAIKGEGPLANYAADLRLASDGVERLAGRVTLAASPEGATRFTADLGGDPAPLFLPEYAAFFGDDVRLQSEGTKAADGRLNLSRLTVETQALQLNGSLQLAPDGLPERFDLTGALGIDGTPVVLPLTTEQRTAVTHADLTLGFDAAKGEGWTADLRLTGLERADFTAREAVLTGSGTIGRPEGRAMAEGSFDFTATGLAPQDAALAKAVGDAITGALQFRWQDGQDALALPMLRVEGTDYSARAAIALAGLSTGITVTGDATLRADDLARYADLAGRPLAGQAFLTISGETALLAGTFDATGRVQGEGMKIGQPEVDNLLSGSAKIDFALRRDETGTTLRQLDLRAASLTARAAGTLATAGSDLTAQVDFTDLSALGGAWRGGVTGLAHIIGTAETGTISFDATGNGLGMGIAEVDGLLRGQSTIALMADYADQVVTLQKATVNAASLSAALQGKLATAGSDVKATLSVADLSALGAGYRGALTAETSFTGTADAGRLTAKATGSRLAIGQTEADRLLAGETQLSADLDLADGQIRIKSAQISNPQLRADAKGTVAGNQRQIDLTAEIVNLATLLPPFPGRLAINGKAVDNGQGYALDLGLRGPGGIDTTVKGRVAPGFGNADLAITGGAEAGLANVFISPTTISGRLRYDLRLKGPLALTSLSGPITLGGLRIAAPEAPAAIDALNGTVTLGSGQARVDLRGNVSTGGSFTLLGTSGLQAPFNGDLAVELRQVHLKDPQLYETRLNGQLRARGPLAGGATIAGDILLNETELRIPSASFGAASGLDDLEHRAEPADVRATRARAGLIAVEATGENATSRPYALDLQITAPQRIFVRGRGLDMEVGGTLQVGGSTQAVVPAGSFKLVRGRLDILGKRLTISEADVNLQGDLDPYLSVKASTENDGVVSSVVIEGRASAPEVRFESAPELPQEEVLAQLLFGQDLSSLSAFQAAQLASAVATLAGKGGDGIVGKLRQGFGLDDLDVTTNAEGDTTLKAGKYISRNAYTEVEVDQSGKAQINLNLDVTDSLTVRGSVGAEGETSIGIFKEKDY